MKNNYILIDNFNQNAKEFKTLKDLKWYARERKCTAKKCYMSNNWYYLDNAF